MYKIIAIFALLFLIMVTSASCSELNSSEVSLPPTSAAIATAPTGPTLTPSATSGNTAGSPTASPEPDGRYAAGDTPFAGLQANSIGRIRIIQYNDYQPPEYADPYKDVYDPSDIETLADILKQVTVKRKVDIYSLPVGATGYSILINLKNEKIIYVYLYGDHNLTQDGAIYEINKLSGLDSVFKKLKGRTRLLPENEGTTEALNSDLFEIGGWSYHLEPDGLARENGDDSVEIIDKLIDTMRPAVFQGKGRILFTGYKNKNSHDYEVLVSINPDGNGRKVLAANKNVIELPIWDGENLYYVGWSKDLAYPRPVYRVDSDLGGRSKAAAIPGPLLTVQNGSIYCLSGDGNNILNLPSGKTVATFASPVVYVEHRPGMIILYAADQGVFTWTVETGVVPVKN